VDAWGAAQVTAPISVIGGSGRTGRQIVDRVKRDASDSVRVLSRHGGELDAEMLVGSISDRDDVRRAVSDAYGVVICVESSEQPGPNGPEAVHFHGVENVIAAVPVAAHIVLVTHLHHPPGGVRARPQRHPRPPPRRGGATREWTAVHDRPPELVDRRAWRSEEHPVRAR
jgi:NAD(P)H-binding